LRKVDDEMTNISFGYSMIGAIGPTGNTGSAGTKIYSSTGAPSEGLGSPGDFYIDLDTGIFYGPRA
jgi:hypothetical protein